MRTLDIAELKILTRTYERNLVYCHTSNKWSVEDNDDCDDVEHVNLDNDAAELLAIWVKEDAIVHYMSAGSTPEEFGKEIYDAWRSVQAYGKQPHDGYLKAIEHGIKKNDEHFDDEVEQLEEFIRREH